MPRYQGDHRLARALLSAPYPLPLVYIQGDSTPARARQQVTIVPIYAPPPLPSSTQTAFDSEWKITPVHHAEVEESTPMSLKPKKGMPSSGRMIVDSSPAPIPRPGMGRGKSGNETDLMSGIEDAPCIELQKAREIGRWSNETRAHAKGGEASNVLTAAFEATMSRSFLDLLPPPATREMPTPPAPPPARPPPPLFPTLVKQEPVSPPLIREQTSLPAEEASAGISLTIPSRTSTPSPPRATDTDGEADSEDSGDTWVPSAPPPRIRPVPRAPPAMKAMPMMLHTQPHILPPSRRYVHPSRRALPQHTGFASESSVATVRRVPRSKRHRPARRWEVIEEEEIIYRSHTPVLHRRHLRGRDHEHRPHQPRLNGGLDPARGLEVKRESGVALDPSTSHHAFRNIQDLTRPKRRPSTPGSGSRGSDQSGGRDRKKLRQHSLTPVPETKPLVPSLTPLIKPGPISPVPPCVPALPPWSPSQIDHIRSRTVSPPTARQSHFPRQAQAVRRYSDIPMASSSSLSGRFPVSQLVALPSEPQVEAYEYEETDRAYSPMSIDPVSGRPMLSTSWPHALPAREMFRTRSTAPPASAPWIHGYFNPRPAGWYDSPMPSVIPGSSTSSGRTSGVLPMELGFGKQCHSILLASRRKSADKRRRREERRRSSMLNPVAAASMGMGQQDATSVDGTLDDSKPPRKRRRYWTSDEDLEREDEGGVVNRRRLRHRGEGGQKGGLLPPAEIDHRR